MNSHTDIKPDAALNPPLIRRRLLRWWSLHRRNYPWRAPGRSLFEILLAEILLKRTTATAVAGVYAVFMVTYPTPRSILDASSLQIQAALKPLGLQRQKSRDLKAFASAVAEGIPRSYRDLKLLPGVGEYSARAVMSFALGQPSAVVDGNVRRVLGRLAAVSPPTTQSEFQALADRLLPRKRHRDFNLAMIDLAAAVCRPSSPKCGSCPLELDCDYAKGTPDNPARSRGSNAIKAIRAAHGTSLEMLARQAGVSKTTIINAEAGRTQPSPTTIAKIAAALGTASAELEASVR